jgi:hypothetical protein
MSSRSHYDVLEVSRTASPEVIRAAYRSLCLKYHPDRASGGDADGHMAAINAAYDVLSDPVKRALYDARLSHRRPAAHPPQPSTQTQRGTPTSPETPPKAASTEETEPWLVGVVKDIGRLIYQLLVFAVGYSLSLVGVAAVLLLVIWIAMKFTYPESERTRTAPTAATMPVAPAPASGADQQAPRWVRPTTTPYGNPWPVLPSLLDGAPQRRTNGLSSLEIDNTSNDSDVHVKLVAVAASSEQQVVREAYVPRGTRFTFARIARGRYHIRYLSLADGLASRSEEFALEETRSSSGTEYSVMSVTLYRVSGGNFDTQRIPRSAF